MDFENVKKAIKALQEGKIILVTDDEPGNCTEAYV